jgi:hypothetical protein
MADDAYLEANTLGVLSIVLKIYKLQNWQLLPRHAIKNKARLLKSKENYLPTTLS